MELKTCETCGVQYAPSGRCPRCDCQLILEAEPELELDWGDRRRPQPEEMPLVAEGPQALPPDAEPPPDGIEGPGDTETLALFLRGADWTLMVGLVFECCSGAFSLVGAGLRWIHAATADAYLPSPSRGLMLFVSLAVCVTWTALVLDLGGGAARVARLALLWLMPLWPWSRRTWANLAAEISPAPRVFLLMPVTFALTCWGWLAWGTVVRVTSLPVTPPGLVFESLLAFAAAYAIARLRGSMRAFHSESAREELASLPPSLEASVRAGPVPRVLPAVPLVAAAWPCPRCGTSLDSAAASCAACESSPGARLAAPPFAHGGVAAASLPVVGAPSGAPPSPATCVGCGAAKMGWICPRCGAVTTLDDYVVTEVLAVRAHGRTYLARGADGAAVVIKELVFGRAADAAVIDAFEREAELLAALRHPQLPRFIAHLKRLEESGALRLFTVMTRLSGAPLDQLAREQLLSPARLAALLRDGLDLLVYLQSRGRPLLHRDIKPSNLLLSAEGKVSLVDFGVARHVAGPGYDGTMVGTVGYIPPEQLAGRVDKRSDPYALAMTVICLLSGREPVQLMTETGAVQVPPLPIDGKVARVLRRMVAATPDKRYPDARAARAALDAQPVATQLAVLAAVALLIGGGIAGVRHWRTTPSFSPQPAAAPPPLAVTGVIARFAGGVLTRAEVEAEFDRLPPVLIDGYPDFRTDLVYSLVVQRQLETLAIARGLGAGDRLESLRKLIGASGDRLQSRKRFLELLETVPRPVIIDGETLRAIPRVPHGLAFAPPFGPARRLEIKFDDMLTLVGETQAEGTFELALPESSRLMETFTRSLRPIDWLYIDLVEPGLTRGNYVVHDEAMIPQGEPRIRSGRTWLPFPPAAPAGPALLARYSTQVSIEPSGGLQERDTRLAWERVREGVARCVLLAAWDLRYSRADVRFEVTVRDGLMQPSSSARFEATEGLASNAPRFIFVRYDRAAQCHWALTRYRFPAAVSGSAAFALHLEGEPWSAAEQEAYFTK